MGKEDVAPQLAEQPAKKKTKKVAAKKTPAVHFELREYSHRMAGDMMCKDLSKAKEDGWHVLSVMPLGNGCKVLLER